MAHSLPAAGNVAARRRLLPALPGSWPQTLLWMGGIALCLSFGIASSPRLAWSGGAVAGSASARPAGSAESPPAPAAGARARCTRCGTVEAVRRIEAAGAQPAQYELTVRLRDGSLRASTVDAATASAWAVGDRIMFVGGT